MGNRVQLDPKLLSETRAYSFNFLSKLPAGDSLISASCLATVYSGNDPSPQGIVFGAANVASPVVTQNVQAGVLGTIYELACTAVSAQGLILTLMGYLAVVPDLA
jgi:hypothetical protein